jgi:hypothetical protein
MLSVRGVADGEANRFLDGADGVLPMLSAVVVVADEKMKGSLDVGVDVTPAVKSNENGFVVDTVVCAPVKMLLKSGAGNGVELCAG